MNEQEKIAYTKGFDAAWSLKIGGIKDPNNPNRGSDNPYNISGQGTLWRAWQDGYDDCLDSSKKQLHDNY